LFCASGHGSPARIFARKSDAKADFHYSGGEKGLFDSLIDPDEMEVLKELQAKELERLEDMPEDEVSVDYFLFIHIFSFVFVCVLEKGYLNSL
jgi:hypothetical protein